MAQVKKSDVRERILLGAYETFRNKGYQNTQMTEIAKAAGVTPSNIYNYYASKFRLFYEVFSPILIARLERMAEDVRKLTTARERLRLILQTLWVDIPNEDNSFSHNLIQAIVTAPPESDKPHFLLKWCEDFVRDLIAESLPPEREGIMRDSSLAFLIWMAFDGFSVNAGRGEDRDMESLITSFVDLLLGTGK